MLWIHKKMYYVLLDVNLDSKNTPLGFAGTKGFT